MILANLLLASAALGGASEPAPVAGPVLSWSAPTTFVAGLSYEVQIDVEAPEGGTVVASWLFSPAAFTVDGKPLSKREDRGTLQLPAGFKISGRLDLGPHLKPGKSFKLGFATDISDGEPIEVQLLELAPDGLDFMAMPIDQLSKFNVLLRTNRGDIVVKVWPDVAPNHARNFLDLTYTDFYDETTFHRVIPGFMIQGGDRTGSGGGTGPRQLTLEPSEKPHVRGVLSMARTNDPNGASCQFFIMHGNAKHLDGQYTAFGEVLSGMDAVDRIATAATGRSGSENSRPLEPQTILRALVVQPVK
ncbi:MAG TPA: peptidylprolyl isomerase [Planctomycetota bacterium]|nr:peptidylprolyl isomerase [Planctomycetota bacterium]